MMPFNRDGLEPEKAIGTSCWQVPIRIKEKL